MIKKIIVDLKRKGTFAFIPDKLFYEITYRIHCKGRLDWKNPQTYSEKLNWLKLYYRKEELKRYVDKETVRDYVREKVGKDYLIPIYGVYDFFDDINFELLPEGFVMKCTHDSGSARVIDKKKCDWHEEKQFFERRLKIDFFHYSGREWPYKGLKPKIIIEEFLEDKSLRTLQNYKFHCFNGVPKFLQVETGIGSEVIVDYFNFDFEQMPFYRKDHPRQKNDKIEKPSLFPEMLEVATCLSKGFHYVRVDLYQVNNKIYFSELTLYPGAGFIWFTPDEWNYKIGDMISIDGLKSN